MAKKLHFGYTISQLLSTGIIKPLLYWGVLCVVIIIILGVVAAICPGVNWVHVVGAFLDPGVFGGSATEITNPWLRLLLFGVSILGVFFVAALLISIISNTFDNITTAYTNGDLRKSLKNHIIIIGTGDAVNGVLRQSLKESKKVVVFAPNRPNLEGDYYFFRGNKTSKYDLKSIGIEYAEKVYILSDKDVPDDDVRCLTCLDILKELSKIGNRRIHCYVIVNEFTTNEIFSYAQNSKSVESSNIFLVDIINSSEYIAEQLMIHSDFLPIIHEKDKNRGNIVILGAGNIARGIAYTAAHICHYPYLNGKLRKTRITIMDKDVMPFMEEFIAARPGLFELSAYSFVNNQSERMEVIPQRDYQDIEWEFVALSPISELGQKYLNNVEEEIDVSCHYVVCPNNNELTHSYIQHLPRKCYLNPIAVYTQQSDSMINRANSTGMYGRLIPFGFDCALFNHQLITERAERGKRVNFIFDQTYAEQKSSNPEEAWYKISETDKLSSIYCALAFSLRDKCFDKNNTQAIYEAEHRRWMSSVLLLGYSYAADTDKNHFLHHNLLPYSELIKEEQEKDKTLLDAADYILKGVFIFDKTLKTDTHLCL